MVPRIFRKNAEIKLEFTFKGQKYIMKGINKFKENKITFQFGNYGDSFPCIINEYDIEKNEYFVHKLRAKSFGGWNNDDKVVCLKPGLPEKGSLDLLVSISIALGELLNKNSIVKLRDDAKIDDNYPLTWKKFFTKKQTAYSKYGFILRKPGYSINSFTKTIEKTEDLLHIQIKDLFTKRVIHEIKNEINIINKINMKKEKFIFFDTNQTFREFLENVFDSRKYDEVINIVSKNCDFDLRGFWYLSWEYYDEFIPEYEKIMDLTVSEIF
jgi:hypothetical protein